MTYSNELTDSSLKILVLSVVSRELPVISEEKQKTKRVRSTRLVLSTWGWDEVH